MTRSTIPTSFTEHGLVSNLGISLKADVLPLGYDGQAMEIYIVQIYEAKGNDLAHF